MFKINLKQHQITQISTIRENKKKGWGEKRKHKNTLLEESDGIIISIAFSPYCKNPPTLSRKCQQTNLNITSERLFLPFHITPGNKQREKIITFTYPEAKPHTNHQNNKESETKTSKPRKPTYHVPKEKTTKKFTTFSKQKQKPTNLESIFPLILSDSVVQGLQNSLRPQLFVLS